MSFNEYHNTILQGDALETLRTLPAGIAQTCVTSPPYWGLRDYGTARWVGGDASCDHIKNELRRGVNLAKSVANTRGGAKKAAEVGGIPYRDICGKCGARREDKQLGHEATPEEYVGKLVDLFREVRRVLRDDGVLWLNLGDSYANNPSTSAIPRAEQGNGTGAFRIPGEQHVQARRQNANRLTPMKRSGLKHKDLVGIPWMVAFALRADGWYLRADIIWHKPNPMPESVTDRPTKSHEYVFLLSKRERYYYDFEAIKEPCESGPSDIRKMRESLERIGGKHKTLLDELQAASALSNVGRNKRSVGDPSGRNKRSVWTVATTPYRDAHFATFPPALIEPCILAGSRPGGLVLDPFMGAGTVGVVARRHSRAYLGIELNPDYVAMAERRIAKELQPVLWSA